MIAHPFHIHDIQFNILEINGAAPPPHQAGWKDVVLVPAQMGTAKFIAKFEDFADPVIPFMYHCHIVGHEEEGMMGQFTVVDDNVEIETIENNQFLMYPNPSTNQLHIQLINSTNSLASVFDVSGQLLLQKKLSTAENTIDVSNLPLGTYFIRINNATTTFIKQ